MVPFVPTPEGYRALAELLSRAWPELPTVASFLQRQDVQMDPRRRVRREVVPAPGGGLAGVVEWGRHPFEGDDARFQVKVAVDPAWGRQGLGAALLGRGLELLGGEVPAGGEWRVECQTTEDRPWACRLLERSGFQVVHRQALSELELARFDPTQWAARCAEVEAAGLELRALGPAGVGDESLLRAVHALQRDVARDVPGVEGESTPPFEVWRRAYRDNPDLLPEGHVLAFDRGGVVGVTQLWASQATDQLLFTGFTGVARAYRRRGVATALKVRALGWACGLRSSTGAPPVVRTANAESNPMLALNLALGFTLRPASLRYERRTPAFQG